LRDDPVSGRVVTFDAAAGLGEIEGSDGRRYPFHCTQIADGTRAVAPGTAVTFAVVPAPLGRWEAARITTA
jgi:CspA family cold shock protein